MISRIRKFLNVVLVLEAIIIVTLLILVGVKLSNNVIYGHKQQDLIASYYSKEDSDVTDLSFVDVTTEASNVVAIPIGGKPKNGVDSILRYAPLDIELPVCIGDFEKNIAAFNLTVFDPNSELGKTTYSIMGHHSIALQSAFGWLTEVKKGDTISLEHNGKIYNYTVSGIYIGYAEDMVYLFSMHNENVVYLSTCDYTLGDKDRIIYRALKCLPN